MTRVALLAALLLASPAMAQRQVPIAGWDGFVRAFDAAADSDRVVGAGVVLVRDGRVIARHEYGFADQSTRAPITDRSLFHYGSITKTLTGIAIMQLRDRGKLSLDDHITRWVPDLRQVHDPYGMIDSITIRMLLSHSAGFQNPTWPYTSGKAWEPFEPTTWNQLVAMMPYQELLFRPGAKYSYSNPGVIYLARVIESISGDAWQSYIYKNIFAPLGLTRSYFGSTPYYLQADRPHNYSVVKDSSGTVRVRDNGVDFDPGITIPNGGWNAPLDDLASYVAFLTNATRGDAETRRRYDAVLSRASLEEMWRPVVATPPAAGDSVGLSFFIVRHAGPRLIGHTGSQAGYLSFLYINPATNTGIVAAFTTENEIRRSFYGFRAAHEAALALIR